MTASGLSADGRGRERPGERVASFVPPVAVVVMILATWQVVAVAVDDPVNWPTFTAVLGRFIDLWLANPTAWIESLAPSLGRILAGWSIAIAVGVATGILIGSSLTARETLDPLIAFLRSIPPPVLIPLFILLLGIGDGMKVALIAFGVVWPILLNTADGVRSVEPGHREAARAFRIGRRDLLARIVLPSAAPRIFAGLRVSLSIAVILMVISEMTATTSGLGFELVQAQRSFRTLDVWATIMMIGLLGALLNAALAIAERRVLRWHFAVMVR